MIAVFVMYMIMIISDIMIKYLIYLIFWSEFENSDMSVTDTIQ